MKSVKGIMASGGGFPLAKINLPVSCSVFGVRFSFIVWCRTLYASCSLGVMDVPAIKVSMSIGRVFKMDIVIWFKYGQIYRMI